MIYLKVAGAVALAILAAAVAAFTLQHPGEVALATGVAAVCFLILLRVVFWVLGRWTVKTWNQLSPKPVAAARPALPDPAPETAAAPGRAFSVAGPDAPPQEVPAFIPAVQGCEGPECGLALPSDPDDRWRCGTGALDGEEGGSRPLRIGKIHEFCSEACMDGWMAEHQAASGQGAR